MATQIPARTEATPATNSARLAGRAIFFAPIGDGRRRRRGSDGVRLILASLAVLCAVLVLRSNSHPEDVITHVLSPPPYGVRWLVTLIWIGGSSGTIAFLLAVASLAKRWMVVRDLAASAVGTLVVSGILVLALGASGGRPRSIEFYGYVLSFPVLHVALALGVATAGLPYLSRTVQRLIELIVFLTVLATVVAGHGLPANVLGSMAIGWGVTAAIHLGWGSPLGCDRPLLRHRGLLDGAVPCRRPGDLRESLALNARRSPSGHHTPANRNQHPGVVGHGSGRGRSILAEDFTG